jgi:hypothetical protein
MSEAARLTGVNVAIDISPSGSGADFTAFGAIQSANIDQSKQLFDATAGLDANIVELAGKPVFRVSGTYVMEHDNDAILDAAEATSPKLLRVYMDKTNHPSKYWQGLMNVSGGVNISVTAAVTGPINLTAAGSITRTWS